MKKKIDTGSTRKRKAHLQEILDKVSVEKNVDFEKAVVMLPILGKSRIQVTEKGNPSQGWVVLGHTKIPFGSSGKSSRCINKNLTVNEFLQNQLSNIVAKQTEVHLSTQLSENRDTISIEGEQLKGSEQINYALEINSLKEKVETLLRENVELKEMLINTITQAQFEDKMQYIPVEIYLDTKNSNLIFGIYDSVLKLLESIGFSKSIELPAVKKSWYKRMVAKSKTAITSDEVISRLKEVEYGVEVNTILKQQSEIDKNQSEALVNILKSLEKVNNGVIRIGSLLVVKITEVSSGYVNVQVRTLSINEMYLLNKDPSLLSKPQQILDALSKAIDSKSETSIN